MQRLRENPQLAKASYELIEKFQGQYKKARDRTVHQLYQAILIAFLRQMGDMIVCLKAQRKNASSTANGDSSGSEQE